MMLTRSIYSFSGSFKKYEEPVDAKSCSPEHSLVEGTAETA